MNNWFKIFRYFAIFGNIIFICWITYNGIDEGFSGTIVQKISYISLFFLLTLNIFLLYQNKSV